MASHGEFESERDWKCSEDDILDSYTFSEKVKNRLEKLGVIDRPRPRLTKDHEAIYPEMRAGQYFDGSMPATVRKMSLDQISLLNSLFANWYAYVHSQTAIIQAERSEADHQKQAMWSLLRDMHKYDKDGKKRSDQQRSDRTRIDTRFIKYNARFEEFDALYQYMQAVLKATTKDMTILSREVTIRQAEMEARAKGRGFNRRMVNAMRQEDDVEEYEHDLGNFQDERSSNTPAKAKGRKPRPTKRRDYRKPA